MPQKSISMTLLAIQYVFNTHRNTESPYRIISRYGFARRYSPLAKVVDPNQTAPEQSNQSTQFAIPSASFGCIFYGETVLLKFQDNYSNFSGI